MAAFSASTYKLMAWSTADNKTRSAQASSGLSLAFADLEVTDLYTPASGSLTVADDDGTIIAAFTKASGLTLSKPLAMGSNNITGAAAITAAGLVTGGSLVLASGATVTAILDEDAMGSNSATALATQQSIKAYVDSQSASGHTLTDGTTALTISGGDTLTFTDSDGVNAVTSATDTVTFSLSASNTTQTSLASLVTVGALNSGSIASGFGAINNGASAITTTGTGTVGTLDVTSGGADVTGGIANNSGGITAAGSIAGATSIDGSGDLTMGTITMAGFTVDADGDTNLKTLAVDDGSTIGCDSDADLMTLASAALTIKGTVTVGVNDTGHDVKFFGATAGAYMLWDESADTLVLPDSVVLQFGTDGDVEMSWQNGGAVFDIDTAAVDWDASAAIAIDSTAGVSLGAGAASDFTTTAGALTLDGAGGVNIAGNAAEIDLTTSGALDLNSGAGTWNASTLALTSTGLATWSMMDNNADALVIQEASNVYLTFDTTDGDETVIVGKSMTFEAGAMVEDNQSLTFGTNDDWSLLYDETTDDAFEIQNGASSRNFLQVTTTAVNYGNATDAPEHTFYGDTVFSNNVTISGTTLQVDATVQLYKDSVLVVSSGPSALQDGGIAVERYYTAWGTADETSTAQGGGTNTITLAADAEAVDDEYNTWSIAITGGTGAGQQRTISDYVGATKVATVNAEWATNPDSTSTYAVHETADRFAVMIFDESANQFAFGRTHLDPASGNVAIEDYMNMRLGAFTADDACTFTSTFSSASGSNVGNLTFANGSITDSSGAISFGNEALTTTGTMTAATGSVFGNLTLANGSITDSSGAISFSNENLSTTGTLASGVLTVTGAATATGVITGGSITTAGTFNADGACTLAATGVLTDVQGTLSVDEAATLDSTLTVAGTTTANGAFVANGDVDLGNATTDTVSFTARVDTDVDPSADASKSLGSATLQWNEAWVRELCLDLDVVNGGTVAAAEVLEYKDDATTPGVESCSAATANPIVGFAMDATGGAQYAGYCAPILDGTCNAGGMLYASETTAGRVKASVSSGYAKPVGIAMADGTNGVAVNMLIQIGEVMAL